MPQGRALHLEAIEELGGEMLTVGGGSPIAAGRILPSRLSDCTMSSAASAIGRASASMLWSFKCALSEKFSLMRLMRSMHRYCIDRERESL